MLSKVSRKVVICEKSLKDAGCFNYYTNYDFDNWKPPIQRINWISSLIPNNCNILDIGCGAYPVSANIPSKYKVGVDISLKAAKKANKHFNKIFLFDLKTIEKDEVAELLSKFDYIILAETLEHFEDTYNVLRKMHWFLKPNGKVIITYPNHFSLSMWIDYITNKGIFRRYREFMEGHFTFYTKEQLELVFHSSGFSIEKFDFRPCDIIPDKFPKENNKIWKFIAEMSPNFLGHQFFYVLKKDLFHQNLPKRFKVIKERGVKIVEESGKEIVI